MKAIIYLLIASVVLMTMVIGFTFITSVIEIFTLGNRVEDSLIAAGWSAFSKVDLDRLAERKNMGNEQVRDVYLDKSEARGLVLQYIKMNLKLDAAYYPKHESYILLHRAHPILIDELEIYNPSDLPVSCSRGQTFNRTTVHIVVSIPVDIKWLGFRYLEKHVDVDMKSFYTN